MTQTSLRRWLWVHKWTSLVSTSFLLVICITGLPLIFGDEIRDWLDDGPASEAPAGAASVSLDGVVATARHMYPGEVIGSLVVDDDEPKIMVSMTPSWAAFIADRKSLHWITFDAHTGDVLRQSRSFGGDAGWFLDIVLELHRDLFAGLPGELFMGLMALLFVAAIVSGAVVYAPFMRRLPFGAVRLDRPPGRKWLDLHNLLGIVTVAWALVVGMTGVINELSKPLFGLWQMTDVRAMLAPMTSKPVPAESELSSPQAAYDTVKTALPDMIVTGVAFPGSPFGSPYHYLIWTKGRTPLTSRLFSPALVDARTGALTSVVNMPWYLRALEVSRPLHFGDYGGMPLKIIWALLDLVTIVVLGSGLHLWLRKEAGFRIVHRSAHTPHANSAAT